MNLQVEVKSDSVKTIQIIDYTIEDIESGLYLPEEIPTEDYLNYPNQFKYSESCTIDIILYLPNNESIQSYYSIHNDELNPLSIPLEKDGYYKLSHIVLPTLEWFEKIKYQDWKSAYGGRNYSEGIIIINTEKNQLEKIDTNGNRIKIEELIVIERNIADTTISREFFDLFSINNLRTCYLNLLNLIFNDNECNKCSISNLSLIFKKDFLMMTINIIQILLERKQCEDAQIILDKLKCYNFCGDNKSLNLKTSNCGCKG